MSVRRVFNQGIFDRIYVDAEQDSEGDFTPPFAVLLNTDVHAQLQGSHSNPTDPKAARCSNETLLAPPTGFEPVPPP